MMEQYKKSGVDVEKTDKLVNDISGYVKGIGGFGGLHEFGNHFLVGSTDGVGTKILLAKQYNKLEGIGIDCVAMCVNDIICTGASPMFFLDYYASSKINESDYKTIISSIKTGCDISNMSLIGGETAELPGMINGDHFDIAGFCLGKVKKKHLINNYHSKIKHGDLVLGFQSSGFHSNGFSLIRKIFDPKKHEKYIDEILMPTKIYVDTILHLLKKIKIKGIANITGGGLSNLNRILPEGLNVDWDLNIPKSFIFDIFKKDGNLKESEMNFVFNNGLGMCIVIDENELKSAMKYSKEEIFKVGKII